MVETKEFKTWHHMETLRRNGKMAEIDAMVERELKKIKIEVHDEDGRWTEVKESDLRGNE
jgi:hypothetical protein